MTSEDSDRLQRLQKALATVKAMNGSPDIIHSLEQAIKDVRKTTP